MDTLRPAVPSVRLGAARPLLWVLALHVLPAPWAHALPSMCIRACAAQGVPLTHGNLSASLANIAATYEFVPADRSYLVMPLFHVHGLMAGGCLRGRGQGRWGDGVVAGARGAAGMVLGAERRPRHVPGVAPFTHSPFIRAPCWCQARFPTCRCTTGVGLD